MHNILSKILFSFNCSNWLHSKSTQIKWFKPHFNANWNIDAFFYTGELLNQNFFNISPNLGYWSFWSVRNIPSNLLYMGKNGNPSYFFTPENIFLSGPRDNTKYFLSSLSSSSSKPIALYEYENVLYLVWGSSSRSEVWEDWNQSERLAASKPKVCCIL